MVYCEINLALYVRVGGCDSSPASLHENKKEYRKAIGSRYKPIGKIRTFFALFFDLITKFQNYDLS